MNAPTCPVWDPSLPGAEHAGLEPEGPLPGLASCSGRGGHPTVSPASPAAAESISTLLHCILWTDWWPSSRCVKGLIAVYDKCG